jgi:hypothetical protein
MTRTGISGDMLALLHAPTPEDEKKTRQGPGGHMLTYIDARYVMSRLDELGGENWQDRYEDRADGSVRCGIGVLVDGEWVWKWDVGDPSDIEANKGVHSEAFKRAAVKWGIARDLYGHANGRTGASSPPRPVPAPRPVSPAPVGGALEEPPELAEMFDHRTDAQRDAVATSDGFCPDHGEAWVLKPGGVSANSGKAYDPFWACPSRERPFCKQKPSKAFLAHHEG